jgi:hypothetical protein
MDLLSKLKPVHVFLLLPISWAYLALSSFSGFSSLSQEGQRAVLASYAAAALARFWGVSLLYLMFDAFARKRIATGVLICFAGIPMSNLASAMLQQYVTGIQSSPGPFLQGVVAGFEDPMMYVWALVLGVVGSSIGLAVARSKRRSP